MKRTIIVTIAILCSLLLSVAAGCNNGSAQIAELLATQNSLQGQLADAQVSVTSLQAQLAAEKDNVARLQAQLAGSTVPATLQADLAAANAKVTSLSADLATASGKVTTLQAGLDKANADLAKAMADLTRANTDLAKATGDLGKANADLAAQKAVSAGLQAELNKIKDPHHFGTLDELTQWLARDDTNTNPAYAALGLAEKAYVLQVKALRDGYLLPVALDADGQYVYSWNTAVVGGAIYIVSAADDSVQALASFAAPLPEHPLPLA